MQPRDPVRSVTSRRSALGALATVAAGSTVGCLEAIPFVGDEPLTFSASPSRVPDAVLEETGYEEYNQTTMEVERTFEAAGQSQRVVVTNQLAEYDKAVDFGALGILGSGRYQAAIVTALTTPQVDVLGQTFNPVADTSSADLAGMVQDRYDGISNVQQVGEETAPVAGGSTTVGEFEARADLIGAGATVDLTLHIAEAVEAGSDLVVAIGGYPSIAQSRERDDVLAMFAGIEHQG